MIEEVKLRVAKGPRSKHGRYIGYPCVRMRFDGHPLHSESERDIVNLTFSQFLSIFRPP